MAIALKTTRTGRGGRVRRPAMSDINVTPMVDVMLVLLVIFMVTAPLLNVGVPVDLPKTTAAPITGQDEPLVVSVNSQGKVYLQETEIPLENLTARLQAVTQNKPDQRIFVRGDRSINYGRIMEVMGVINQAGFKHVALVAELPVAPASGAAPAAAAPSGAASPSGAAAKEQKGAR